MPLKATSFMKLLKRVAKGHLSNFFVNFGVIPRLLPGLFIAIILAGQFAPTWGLVEPVLAQENAASPSIIFSPDSTLSRQPLQLTLKSTVKDGVIKYTTNGALPNANSTSYTSPLDLTQPTVIRAQVFSQAGSPVGEVYTKSYLIVTYDQTLPLISIVADWTDLDTLNNQPTEHGKEWERPINLEYFAPGGQVQFNVKAGIRIHGGKSRLYSPKKSYRLYFRKEYGGPGNLEYPLFEDSPVTKFDKLVLRAGHNDSFVHYRDVGVRGPQTNLAKYIGDQVVRNLHRDMGQPVAHGKWVLLYLNGQFWGLYNLTERIDLQMLRSYSTKNADWDIIVKENGWDENGGWYSREEARDGGDGAWLENQNWVGSADFTNPGNIGLLEWRVDVENIFSYMFLQAYVQNYDWPGNNWIVYRRSDPGAQGNEGKWRLMVWDAEYSFGSGSDGFKTDMNTVEKVYSPHDSITRLLEKPFIGNCALKVRFWQRAREYLGVENVNNRPPDEVGQLSKERVKAEIQKQAALVRPFIQMEADRWAPNTGLGLATFDHNIENALKFVDERQEVILHHLDILRYQTFTACQ